MDGGHTRAWTRGRRSGPISTICRSRWLHDEATEAVASLRPGYARPARCHSIGKEMPINRQRSHLAEPKRCSGKPSHLSTFYCAVDDTNLRSSEQGEESAHHNRQQKLALL